jgi:hypothetical protein
MTTRRKTALFKRFHPKRLDTGAWELPNGLGIIPACNEITAVLKAARHTDDPEALEYYYWWCADYWWNQDADDMQMARHKWAHRMIYHACREQHLAVGGSASSGKSHTMAGWALFQFMRMPESTTVLVTSTDLKGARKRIWGSIVKLMTYIDYPPWRVKDAIGSLSYESGNKTPAREGIHIVTADKSSDKNKVGKLIGIKSKRVILIADELGDMGPNIQEAAFNLRKNPSFQMIGMSNPGSRFDPFGVFAEPEHGWDSVNVEADNEWRTRLKGLFIRLDAEDSPNLDPEDPEKDWLTGFHFDYLPSQRSIEEDLDATLAPTRDEARKSRSYMRFNRAIFFDSDDDDTIYSEADIRKARADTATELKNVTLVAGVDPSFSSGGDKTVMAVCEVGWDAYAQLCVQLKELVYLHEDMTNKADPRTLQIAEAIRRECVKRKIKPENVGIDATGGGGGGLCDMLQLQWNDQFLRVQFGGKASDRKIKNDSKVVASDRYYNRASELFFVGKQFLLGRQIYGLPNVIIKQMCNRSYLTKKTSRGVVLQVEPKEKYKGRTGSSPDETDAFLVAVETARVRHGFLAADPVKERPEPNALARWLKNQEFIRNPFDPSLLGHHANLA